MQIALDRHADRDRERIMHIALDRHTDRDIQYDENSGKKRRRLR